MYYVKKLVNPTTIQAMHKRLRKIFYNKNIVEISGVQHPDAYTFIDKIQTTEKLHFYNFCSLSHIWLEQHLLQYPDVPGYFCIKNQKPDVKFLPNKVVKINVYNSILEFELKGDIDHMIRFKKSILNELGFINFIDVEHDDMITRYDRFHNELIHEYYINGDIKYKNVVFLKNPPKELPFWWTTDIDKARVKKVDVLLFGIETMIGSQKSNNPEDIIKNFYSMVKEKKYDEKKAKEELDLFLSNKLFTRSGGQIGIKQLIRAIKLNQD